MTTNNNNKQKNKDAELLKLIKEVNQSPLIYRTTTLKLRSQGIKVNHKRVRVSVVSIMRENDLSVYMYNK